MSLSRSSSVPAEPQPSSPSSPRTTIRKKLNEGIQLDLYDDNLERTIQSEIRGTLDRSSTFGVKEESIDTLSPAKSMVGPPSGSPNKRSVKAVSDQPRSIVLDYYKTYTTEVLDSSHPPESQAGAVDPLSASLVSPNGKSNPALGDSPRIDVKALARHRVSNPFVGYNVVEFHEGSAVKESTEVPFDPLTFRRYQPQLDVDALCCELLEVAGDLLSNNSRIRAHSLQGAHENEDQEAERAAKMKLGIIKSDGADLNGYEAFSAGDRHDGNPLSGDVRSSTPASSVSSSTSGRQTQAPSPEGNSKKTPKQIADEIRKEAEVAARFQLMALRKKRNSLLLKGLRNGDFNAEFVESVQKLTGVKDAIAAIENYYQQGRDVAHKLQIQQIKAMGVDGGIPAYRRKSRRTTTSVHDGDTTHPGHELASAAAVDPPHKASVAATVNLHRPNSGGARRRSVTLHFDSKEDRVERPATPVTGDSERRALLQRVLEQRRSSEIRRLNDRAAQQGTSAGDDIPDDNNHRRQSIRSQQRLRSLSIAVTEEGGPSRGQPRRKSSVIAPNDSFVPLSSISSKWKSRSGSFAGAAGTSETDSSIATNADPTDVCCIFFRSMNSKVLTMSDLVNSSLKFFGSVSYIYFFPSPKTSPPTDTPLEGMLNISAEITASIDPVSLQEQSNTTTKYVLTEDDAAEIQRALMNNDATLQQVKTGEEEDARQAKIQALLFPVIHERLTRHLQGKGKELSKGCSGVIFFSAISNFGLHADFFEVTNRKVLVSPWRPITKELADTWNDGATTQGNVAAIQKGSTNEKSRVQLGTSDNTARLVPAEPVTASVTHQSGTKVVSGKGIDDVAGKEGKIVVVLSGVSSPTGQNCVGIERDVSVMESVGTEDDRKDRRRESDSQASSRSRVSRQYEDGEIPGLHQHLKRLHSHRHCVLHYPPLKPAAFRESQNGHLLSPDVQLGESSQSPSRCQANQAPPPADVKESIVEAPISPQSKPPETTNVQPLSGVVRRQQQIKKQAINVGDVVSCTTSARTPKAPQRREYGAAAVNKPLVLKEPESPLLPLKSSQPEEHRPIPSPPAHPLPHTSRCAPGVDPNRLPHLFGGLPSSPRLLLSRGTDRSASSRFQSLHASSSISAHDHPRCAACPPGWLPCDGPPLISPHVVEYTAKAIHLFQPLPSSFLSGCNVLSPHKAVSLSKGTLFSPRSKGHANGASTSASNADLSPAVTVHSTMPHDTVGTGNVTTTTVMSSVRTPERGQLQLSRQAIDEEMEKRQHSDEVSTPLSPGEYAVKRDEIIDQQQERIEQLFPLLISPMQRNHERPHPAAEFGIVCRKLPDVKTSPSVRSKYVP